MDKKNIEQWKPVVGYEGYAVSDKGRVKSVERTVIRKNGRKYYVKEKMLNFTLSGKEGYEYFHVSLWKNGVGKTWGVHQLVALAFPEICGLPFEGAEVNHIDENHFRNVPSNLNWLSRKDNLNHGTGNERRAKANTNGKCSKIVYQYDKDTHELVKEWSSVSEVYRQMGWSQGNISMCCNGKQKTYKGYNWSYEKLHR